jgi:hypothetical protein
MYLHLKEIMDEHNKYALTMMILFWDANITLGNDSIGPALAIVEIISQNPV